jgi:transposase
MNIVHECCAGLDVHKKTVVACVLVSQASGKARKEVRTFSTMTPDIVRMRDWLKALSVTHAAMESTGVFWKPIYNLLEGHLELLLVNAQHIKAVPGRKTDVKDAEWIADLLRHGLLRPSLIPPVWQREVRDLTRSRTSASEERSRAINRLQKILEDTNIKLASVATDIMGASAQDMLHGLLNGETDATVLAQLARGNMRSKRPLLEQALQGRLTDHHRFLIRQQLTHIQMLDREIDQFSAEIAKRFQSCEAAIARLSTIPGIKRRLAEVILSEIGTDMSRFPSARHLASWAGICPGNNESAGKRLTGRTRKGSPWLRTALVEAAQAAARSKECYLSAQFHRLTIRRGGKKAIVAVAHTLLVIVYHVLAEETDYQELGGNYFDERDRLTIQKQLVRRLEKLGYDVTLAPTTPAA